MTNPVGRPSKYRETYCGEVISLMSGGLSLTAAMGDLGFTRQRAHEWASEHPEFRDAIALGQAKRSAFLERRGISAESGPAVTYVMKALVNCNREDFQEAKTVALTGPEGGPIQTEEKTDTAMLARRVAFLLASEAMKSNGDK